MKTIVLANQKGGVGKSAIATQLAHYFHRLSYSVLFIDLDHQQNSSRPLRLHGDVTCATFSACQLMDADSRPEFPTADFLLVPGSADLSTLERRPDRHNHFASRLKTILSELTCFDVCIIDTNPNPDIRYGSALICADYLLAPIQLNQEAMEGIAALLDHPRYGLARIKAVLNARLVFLGLLPNLVEPTPFQRANLRLLISRFGSRLLSARTEGGEWFAQIPKRSAIAEAQAASVFLPDLEKTAARHAWREIRPAFELIADRMGLGNGKRRFA